MGKVSERAERVEGIDAQPVSGVEWIPQYDLRANSYNPNHIAPPELELLSV